MHAPVTKLKLLGLIWLAAVLFASDATFVSSPRNDFCDTAFLAPLKKDPAPAARPYLGRELTRRIESGEERVFYFPAKRSSVRDKNGFWHGGNVDLFDAVLLYKDVPARKMAGFIRRLSNAAVGEIQEREGVPRQEAARRFQQNCLILPRKTLHISIATLYAGESCTPAGFKESAATAEEICAGVEPFELRLKALYMSDDGAVLGLFEEHKTFFDLRSDIVAACARAGEKYVPNIIHTSLLRHITQPKNAGEQGEGVDRRTLIAMRGAIAKINKELERRPFIFKVKGVALVHEKRFMLEDYDLTREVLLGAGHKAVERAA